MKFPKHHLEDKFYSGGVAPSFSPYGIYSIYKDSKGNVWFGTSNLGVCRYDGKSFAWISEADLTELEEGPAPGVRAILEDKEGNFWFSNHIRHRYKVYRKNKKAPGEAVAYTALKGIDISKEQKMQDYFMSITQDDDGDLWMLTYNAGVWRYDGENLIHYPVKEGHINVLLFSIYKDREGGLWLGTHNSGPYKFNGKTFEKFKP